MEGNGTTKFGGDMGPTEQRSINKCQSDEEQSERLDGHNVSFKKCLRLRIVSTKASNVVEKNEQNVSVGTNESGGFFFEVFRRVCSANCRACRTRDPDTLVTTFLSEK
jgi:hypothetical protein